MTPNFRISARIRELNEPAYSVGLLAKKMPSLLQHEGRWQGNFQHFSNEGRLLETHQAVVKHQFPEEGPYAHIQDSHFIWDNGEELHLTQNSIFVDGKLWWDGDPFQGCIWETDFGNILINITQTSDPRLTLNEMICLEPAGNRRSRVKQWFKNGRLFKRTLCHERRISNTN